MLDIGDSRTHPGICSVNTVVGKVGLQLFLWKETYRLWLFTLFTHSYSLLCVSCTHSCTPTFAQPIIIKHLLLPRTLLRALHMSYVTHQLKILIESLLIFGNLHLHF